MPASTSDDALSLITEKDSLSKSTYHLFRSGLLSVGRPDRVAKRLHALATLGPTLGGAFAAAAARDPKRTAIIDDHRTLTYAELDRRVRRIGAGFASLGAGPGRTIAMFQRNSAYAVETMVAASRIGANVVLLNTFLSGSQLTEVLFRELPHLVVVDSDLRDSITDAPEGTQIVLGSVSGSARHREVSLDELAAKDVPEPKRPDAPGRIVILTSGTTGAPKGATRGHTKGLGPAASLLSRIPLSAPETMLIAPPLFHTLGLGFLQLAPAINSTIVLRRDPAPEVLLEALATHRCTSAVMVPVMVHRMADLPLHVRAPHITSALKVVVCSSAPLLPEVYRRFTEAFGDVLYNVYGSTEVSWATIATPDELRLSPGTAGRPPIGTRLALLDVDHKPVPLGEPGNIYVGNEMMFEGYTNGDDRDRFDGLLATGDRGRIDEHGLLTVLGRDDDMVIVGGENLYPMPVEQHLSTLPEVADVAVVGVPDDDLGQRLAAYVVLREGAQLGEEAIRESVRAAFPRFAVPRDVIFLSVLPRNTVGKVVRRLLPVASEGGHAVS